MPGIKGHLPGSNNLTRKKELRMGGANVLARAQPEEKGPAPLPRHGGTADLFVAGGGFEPPTSRLWASRATNCSTPRRKKGWYGTGEDFLSQPNKESWQWINHDFYAASPVPYRKGIAWISSPGTHSLT